MNALVPASYVLLRRTEDGVERVLLQLRRGTGYMDGHWAVSAAGHVEAGEDAVAAAVREAAEELGVVLDRADLVALCAMHRTAGRTEPGEERVDFFFESRRWTGDPRRVEAEKAAQLRWFDLAALPDPVVPHELRVLEGLRRGDVPPVLVEGF
ncbi:NUDIX domain-containing protein [Petropleomorpha daqingensis]|uniref:8-oxo-dGTP pyrophosphatase MutT (NUDIX family) n=1 Tax=Petropleomorpha daqingensis TaxID=2026353 RepID=A0A853CJZ0_9ACTN|nr:8-oxo-dGTP pyrophosphatase MutT (NUDIX family) [Petropleomorpha daqingensis]